MKTDSKGKRVLCNGEQHTSIWDFDEIRRALLSNIIDMIYILRREKID